MPVSRYSCWFIVALLVSTGCQSALWMKPASTDILQADLPREGSLVADEKPEPVVPALQEATSFADPNSFAASAEAAPDAPAKSENKAPVTNDAVLQELQTIGAVDPMAAQKLVERLQTTKTSLRPLVAQQFRASWQYHRELTGQLPPATLQAGVQSQPGGMQAAAISTGLVNATQAAAFDASDYNPADFATLMAGASSATAMPVSNGMSSRLPSPASKPQSFEPATTEPRSAAESIAAKGDMPKEADLLPQNQSQPSAGVKHASYADELKDNLAGRPPAPREWNEAVSQAIVQLENATAKDPHTTAEAYRHVRLRLMQLVAGEKMEALEPIPGLTPTEQSYWSNQLFTIATLLDHTDVGDDAQRASLAGDQLAAASAKLGELATLSVRNLTFCKQVYGFGDFDRKSPAKFKLGDQVTLYAEIENFRSESTEKGYHTALATSYEVLDKHGNRVEQGEFDVVDDYCGRTRRDFYIEYTFALPKRIYPNQYQLKLIIRDRLSGKIGHSVVDFEIAE